MNKTIVYAAWVDVLEDAAVFEKALMAVPPYRREKVARSWFDGNKRLLLGAELLLRRALAEQGIERYTVSHDEYGKPFLTDHPEIHFNLSHSGRAVMCALSPMAVGCDVQKFIDPKAHTVERCLTPREQAGMIGQPDDKAKSAYFTRLWTLKESVVKATGRGLGAGLDGLEFSLGDTATVCADGVVYHVRELEFFAGYAAAVCTAFAGEVEVHNVLLI